MKGEFEIVWPNIIERQSSKLSEKGLLTPDNSAVALIDHQGQMLFGTSNFDRQGIIGIEPNEKRIKEHLDDSLMLVTPLNLQIVYEKAAKISLSAYREDLSLREAALKLGFVTQQQFDSWVHPEEMTLPVRKAVNGPPDVVITGGGFRGLSVPGSTPADFNFDREMVRVEDEPTHPALQR